MTEGPARLSDEELARLESTDQQQPTAEELEAPQRSAHKPSPQTVLCDLPSRGVLYPNFNGESIEILPIRAGVEKQIAGSKGTLAAVIDTLIRQCVVSEGIESGEWLVNDAFYLLLMLRAHTYGDEYQFNVRCQSCGANFTVNLNILEDFEIRRLERGAQEPFGPIELPVSGDEIHYRLLRRKDEKTLANLTRRMKRRGRQSQGDDTYIERLALRIVEVNGETLEHMDKVDYLENLHGGDSLELRNHMDDNDPGIDTTFFADCPECGYENEEVLPLTAEFFRPRSKSR